MRSSTAVDRDADTEAPSKSQRKRDMHAAQKLGETLAALDPARLARIDLPDSLATALLEARHITAHEARRRHLQYIGKLMRQVDVDAIRRQLDDATGDSRAAVALMHRCERLRDALLADDAALTAFAAEFPGADVQHLRATVRAARRELAAGQAPRHVRVLYRWLHEQLSLAAPAA